MIEDTSKHDLEHHLIESLVQGTSRYITSMEAEGQRQLVDANSYVPKDIIGASMVQLENIGFKFGSAVDDPIFIACILPVGWKIEPTDHSMWSDLLDGQGRIRAAIFYKAAFYDRSASMTMHSRFTIDPFHRPSNKGNFQVVAKDANTILIVFGDWEDGYYKRSLVLQEQAQKWLLGQYPDYKNPLAYWDLE